MIRENLRYIGSSKFDISKGEIHLRNPLLSMSLSSTIRRESSIFLPSWCLIVFKVAKRGSSTFSPVCLSREVNRYTAILGIDSCCTKRSHGGQRVHIVPLVNNFAVLDSNHRDESVVVGCAGPDDPTVYIVFEDHDTRILGSMHDKRVCAVQHDVVAKKWSPST